MLFRLYITIVLGSDSKSTVVTKMLFVDFIRVWIGS